MERGKTLGAFVQTGNTSATIEVRVCVASKDIAVIVLLDERRAVQITLAGTAALKGDVCIKREFVIPPGKDCTTKWFVNDEESSEKQVHALLATFHIQMDNLCMFLPQERVGKFSTMAPTEVCAKPYAYQGHENLDMNASVLQLLKVTMRSVGKGLEEQFEKLLQIQDDQITGADVRRLWIATACFHEHFILHLETPAETGEEDY
jgi:hypothetical protein